MIGRLRCREVGSGMLMWRGFCAILFYVEAVLAYVAVETLAGQGPFGEFAHEWKLQRIAS